VCVCVCPTPTVFVGVGGWVGGCICVGMVENLGFGLSECVYESERACVRVLCVFLRVCIYIYVYVYT